MTALPLRAGHPAADAGRPEAHGVPRRVPLAIVQHGHQSLVTNGYADHEDLSELLDGFAALLALHLRHRVPLNLHLSGTLVEAVAWHRPDFFDWVRALRAEGLVELVSSAYAQNVLPLFRAEHNLRQMNETLRLYRRHLGVEPEEVRGFWVPERVWDTARVGPLLADPRLDNGGFRWTLIDDRLTYPLEPAPGGVHRAAFDARTAPARRGGDPRFDGSLAFGGGAHLRPFRIDAGPLTEPATPAVAALPISGELRYCIPPRDAEQWDRLREVLERTGALGDDTLAVYGDDLEKSAVVGPWGPHPWRRELLDPYARFLERLATDLPADAVLASPWLERHPPAEARAVDPGTFYELAAGAGEDYGRFWTDPGFQPHRRMLEEAEALLCREAPAVDRGLWALAWKQLMAASCETAWHELDRAGTGPAPWALATAAHVRTVSVTVAAARWADGPAGEEPAADDPAASRLRAEVLDVDGDGDDEVVLANDHLFAVLTPRYGGRVVALFQLGGDGHLVVGNPADDWNWQEELNRFMAVPRNHPGAFADVGHENDGYRVAHVAEEPDGAEVVLEHADPASTLAGSRKVFRLAAGARHLDVTYHLRGTGERFEVEFGLSPGYLDLLRQGRAGLESVRWRGRGPAPAQRRGWRRAGAAAWVEIPAGQPVVWDAAPGPDCGHGLVVRVTAYRPSFTLRLGTGRP